MNMKKLYIFLVLLAVMLLAAVYFIREFSRFDKAPDGSEWEEYLREKNIIEEGSTNIVIDDKREIAPGVLSFDVNQKLFSGFTKYTMVYVDMDSGETAEIVSYVTTDEKPPDTLHDYSR